MGIGMWRNLVALAIATTMLWTSLLPAGTFAAELSSAVPAVAKRMAGPVAVEDKTYNGCRLMHTCTLDGCGWRRFCARLCVSCFPLYGAYGPYGGTSYWGAYTGWGHRY
jgi:hypothetical protein